MEPSDFPESNRTWRILQKASAEKYAVGAFNCYNNDGVMAVIRAAERKLSPAIIQLFPWTMNFQGPIFIEYVIAAAHAASVPIAVHLDHCIKDEDVQRALNLPFDSIMVDGSTLGESLNTDYCARIVQQARTRGIAIEAELGRIEGGEDGLPHVDMDTILTDAADAKEFVESTGVHFLAPSFGNVHGPYPEGGAEKLWQLDRLADISKRVGQRVPLVLHGTHPVSDELFQMAIQCGVSKINLNRTVRDPYTRFVAENAKELELTVLKEKAVEVYAQSIERMMDVLGSAGKA